MSENNRMVYIKANPLRIRMTKFTGIVAAIAVAAFSITCHADEPGKPSPPARSDGVCTVKVEAVDELLLPSVSHCSAGDVLFVSVARGQDRAAVSELFAMVQRRNCSTAQPVVRNPKSDGDDVLACVYRGDVYGPGVQRGI
jgi:hypothetical protein